MKENLIYFFTLAISLNANAFDKTHTMIMAHQGVKYEIELFKHENCLVDAQMNTNYPIKMELNNGKFAEMKDDVQVATLLFSASYGENANECLTNVGSATLQFSFDKPTVVKIVETSADQDAYRAGHLNSQYYSMENGIWKAGQEIDHSQFNK